MSAVRSAPSVSLPSIEEMFPGKFFLPVSQCQLGLIVAQYIERLFDLPERPRHTPDRSPTVKHVSADCRASLRPLVSIPLCRSAQY